MDAYNLTRTLGSIMGYLLPIVLVVILISRNKDKQKEKENKPLVSSKQELQSTINPIKKQSAENGNQTSEVLETHIQKDTDSSSESKDEDGQNIYADWTKGILEIYKKYEQDLSKLIKEYIEYCELEPMKAKDLKLLSKTLWVSLCMASNSAILDKCFDEDFDCIVDVAKLDKAHFIGMVKPLGDVAKITREKNLDIDCSGFYISPILTYYASVNSDAMLRGKIKKPEDDFCTKIHEIGKIALIEGSNIWRELIAKMFNEALSRAAQQRANK